MADDETSEAFAREIVNAMANGFSIAGSTSARSSRTTVSIRGGESDAISVQFDPDDDSADEVIRAIGDVVWELMDRNDCERYYEHDGDDE